MSSMQVTGEDVFSYDYNGRNQLSSATNPNSVTVSFTYHDGGRRTRMTRPGSYIDYSYNARDWITAVVNRGTGGVSTYRRSRNEVTLRERLSSGIPWLSDECRPLLLWATFISSTTTWAGPPP